MSSKATNKRVLVIVTGGIAVYKAAVVVRGLVKSGAQVRVIMTSAATEFVRPLTFETLSLNKVGVDMFNDPRLADPLSHLSFGTWATELVVCPATANFIGKMANGLADDLASATVLAATVPVMICPAMNSGMWDNPAVKRNVKTLSEWGVRIIGPAEGALACKTSGTGRMVEPEEIIAAVLES